MSFELLFYLAFGFVMLLPARLAAAALVGWGAIIILQWNRQPVDGLTRHLLSPYVLEFLAGCFVAWIRSRGINRGWRTALIASFVYVLGSISVMQLALGHSTGHVASTARLRVAVFGLPSALILYAAVTAEGQVRWRAPRWLLALGDASYSIYLLHTFVFVIAICIGFKIPHTRLPHHLWMGGALVAAIGAGWLGHVFIERPLLNLMNRDSRGQRDVKSNRVVFATRLALKGRLRFNGRLRGARGSQLGSQPR